jgi:hypothetical protein
VSESTTLSCLLCSLKIERRAQRQDSFLTFLSCEVKISFGHFPSFEQSKSDFIYQYFKIFFHFSFYRPSDK